jgi:hypothetical protein
MKTTAIAPEMRQFTVKINADHCIAEGAETLADTPEDGQLGRNM